MSSFRTLAIAGIQLDVWTTTAADPVTPAGQGEDEGAHALLLPISVLFLLHGRARDRSAVADIATRMLRITPDADKRKRELVVVTFDHRNHGSRLVDPVANNGWNTKAKERHNERHALDMYTIQVGSALDVSTLIDFLPSYLYPRNERTIEQWGIAGFSLGGHSTWIAAKNDPRLEVVVPIVGCPDYLSLMRDRAASRGLDASDAIHFPLALVSYIQKHDPVTATPTNPFLGKKILAIAGGKDLLVPWRYSAPFFEERLDVGRDGAKASFVDEEAAHEWTSAMGERMALFVERWCLL